MISFQYVYVGLQNISNDIIIIDFLIFALKFGLFI